MSSIVVVTPTFRRPEGLRRLLSALAEIPLSLSVIVAENDCERLEGVDVVARAKAGSYPHTLDVIQVAERGIAQVRNALVAAAIQRPATEFIAMIDDDEVPLAGWLQAMIRTQEESGADLVGGPVIKDFEITVPSYFANACNRGSERLRTGPIDLVHSTNNVFARAAVFREMAAPWFDPFFGLTGGEDKDLMIRLKAKGKAFAWATEARVVETWPASRCTHAWIVQRAFSSGNSDMLIKLRRRPPDFKYSAEMLKIAAAFGLSALNLSIHAWDRTRRLEGRQQGARSAGKLAAILGHRHLEYRTVHGR